LVDAHLPLRLARVLQSAGCDTIHTKDLPRRNATPDSEINLLSIQEIRIVITKDSEFLVSIMYDRAATLQAVDIDDRQHK
jgi:predicted nuclease of predicted toxin-antitoxin system